MSDELLSQLSPAAAAAAKLIKPNMSLTQIYSQYVATTEENGRLLTENEELRSQIQQLVEEVRVRAPGWQQEKERAEEARSMVKTLSDKLSDASKEVQDLKFQLMDAKTVSEKLRHDAEVGAKFTNLSDQFRIFFPPIPIFSFGVSTYRQVVNFDLLDPKMGVFLQSTKATPCGHLLKRELTPENPPADTMFMAAMVMVLP